MWVKIRPVVLQAPCPKNYSRNNLENNDGNNFSCNNNHKDDEDEDVNM